MKSPAHLSLMLVLVIGFITFYGCRKHDFRDPAQRCRIIETADRFFTYKANGDPVAFTYKENPDWTGNPTFYFLYNTYQRLIAYGSFNSHALTYNTQGQAIIDSVYENYAGQDVRYEDRLFYDHYGRIIKVISKMYHAEGMDLPLPHPEQVYNYQYDTRGNLILPDTDGEGTLAYDNKTSIFRTHPVLMFIHRNYSVNNPVSDTKYNAAGLPLTFYGTFLDGRGVENDIVYDCQNKKNK
jgi:hypothetical protein